MRVSVVKQLTARTSFSTSSSVNAKVQNVGQSLHRLLYDRSYQYREGSCTLVVNLQRSVVALRNALTNVSGDELNFNIPRILCASAVDELNVLPQRSVDTKFIGHGATSEGRTSSFQDQDVVSATMTALLVNGIILNNPKVSDQALGVAGRAFKNGMMTDRVWSDVFLVLALNQCTPQLVDKWLDLYIDTYKNDLDQRRRKIPFQMILNGASHCVFERDLERALRWYNLSKKYEVDYSSCLSPLLRSSGDNGSDGDDRDLVLRDVCDLALCGRVIRAVSHAKFDGGLRDQFVDQIRKRFSVETLRKADWSVIADLISGLSSKSAMALVEAVSRKHERLNMGGQETSEGADDRDEQAPFEVWAALLRLSVGSRQIVEAETLFNFIRAQFELSPNERDSLIELMMKLYAYAAPPDFNTLCCFFFEHVVSTPEGEQPIASSQRHFNFLMQAADSPNATTMIFHEMISRGVPVSSETYQALLRTTNPTSGPIRGLTEKLPQSYEASALDEQLKIPADRDAHLRREEALISRNRAVVDSTGGV